MNKLPQFQTARVLVIGDLMLDRYWHGGTHRISPEAPVPVVHVNNYQQQPGGAGNVALNLRAVGCQVNVLGFVGDDVHADSIERAFDEVGIEHYLVRLKQIPTITKLRVLSQHQQLLRLDFEETFADQDSQPLVQQCQQLLSNIDLIVLSDYGKGTLAKAKHFIQLAAKANIPVLVDPKSDDFAVYRGATMITPNFKEFQVVVGRCDSEADIEQKGQALLKQCDLQALLVTRGEKGMTLLQRDKASFHLPAKVREVFDVTGAGDTVIALLAATLAAGESLVTATKLANTAAGIAVRKLGAASVSVDELKRELHCDSDSHARVLSESALLEVVRHAKQRGETIVMTNGCFDLLHVGHIAYMEQAKQLGDRLIIAVNDDASVGRLKGATRPINTLADRMRLLASLRAVDWIVSFSEDTPARIIGEVLPDVLVKGGDYQADEVAGGAAVVGNGGEVKILSFVDGYSTSSTLRRIVAAEELV